MPYFAVGWGEIYTTDCPDPRVRRTEARVLADHQAGASDQHDRHDSEGQVPYLTTIACEKYIVYNETHVLGGKGKVPVQWPTLLSLSRCKE